MRYNSVAPRLRLRNGSASGDSSLLFGSPGTISGGVSDIMVVVSPIFVMTWKDHHVRPPALDVRVLAPLLLAGERMDRRLCRRDVANSYPLAESPASRLPVRHRMVRASNGGHCAQH